MSGVIALRKIQIGRESTAGTAVAATTVWRGMGLLQDQRTVQHVDEQIGVALPTTRAYVPKLGATVALDPIEATFQQLPHLLEAGVQTATPADDGVGTGKIYTYILPKTSMNTIKTYTIEGGDNQQAREVDYCFVESFKLSGTAGEGVMMEGTFRGRDVVNATFTGSVPVPTLLPGDHVVFGGSTLHIDAVGGTIGTTAVASTLLSFELDVTTGLTAKFTNLGKDFDFVYFDRGAFSATLRLVYEHNAAAVAQMALYEAATPRLVRLTFLGRALGTAGTAWSTHGLQIDAAGIYTAMPYGDVDGNATVEAEMQIGHDLTADLGLTLRVVNELASLP